MYPSLSSKYVHTLDIPETINHIKEIILKYKGEKKVWEMNIKHILESNKIISEVEYENPIINWNKIWNQIYMIKNSTHTHTHTKKKKKKKTIIFRHIYGILPLGDYLVKHKILKQRPPCTMCKKDFYTFKHIFT